MSNKKLASAIILGLTILATYIAIKDRNWFLAMAVYWGGFTALFAYTMVRAYIVQKAKIKEAVAEEMNNVGLWISPLSRKVLWGDSDSAEEVPGAELGIWQDRVIRKAWNINGQVWHWVGNTVKDEWPKTAELKDGMRWWQGVAIYTDNPESAK